MSSRSSQASAQFTVLLQQGGQLKDMFGGAVPAAKALGGYILGLINPLTITLTVATALGAAWYKGSQEADEFARALILTGNAAGRRLSASHRCAMPWPPPPAQQRARRRKRLRSSPPRQGCRERHAGRSRGGGGHVTCARHLGL
ncbi:phage tail length tape measure family protein [Dentiradicibacter hellwigii]|uniref:Phage tail length tape measure family protein n=1 Tax=Dentiradicibacter hellwigii TaxID=3149053 RepID=A0ABV4UD66_9RHOO